jgi:hypothetical protein
MTTNRSPTLPRSRKDPMNPLDVWAMTLVLQWSKDPPGDHRKFFFYRPQTGNMGLWGDDIGQAQPYELDQLEPICRVQAASPELRSALAAKGYQLVSVVPNRIVIPPADMLLPVPQKGAGS